MEKKGLIGASGIAIAKAFVYSDAKIDVSAQTISVPEAELNRLDLALQQSKDQLQAIYSKALNEIGADEAAIFDAHMMVLEDPEYVGAMKKQIQEESVNAEYAVDTATGFYTGMFEVMDDPYFSARAADLRDVGQRILSNLAGVEMVDLSQLDEDIILIAHDLTPSGTAQMDKVHVKGIATDLGSKTSHTAIMARSLEIPAVVGLNDLVQNIQTGTMVIVDGLSGQVIIAPSEEILEEYRRKQSKYTAELEELAKLKDLPAETMDGYRVTLVGNIGKPADCEGVLQHGGKGVGLFRTEFLYMNSDTMPREDQLFAAYRSVVESFPEEGVIIRTFDIGGDKKLPYLPMDEEMNPFLGLRAIRLCFEKPDLFKTQLRAILRASAFGKLMVMFPMISGVEEFRQAKAYLAECMTELDAAGLDYDHDIKVGTMIEIPSAAITADILAQESDFFSIGSNDLCQYTLAVDRMSQKVSYLYDPFHPAILRLIKTVIQASNESTGCFTGMCGEMAGDPAAALLLLGLGLHEFSVSAGSIPVIKKVIRSVRYEDAKGLAEQALQLKDGKAIRALAEEALKEIAEKA